MKNIYIRLCASYFKSARISYSGRLVVFFLFLSQFSIAQSLQLPFFDDFSSSNANEPSYKLWINGGTLLNNTYAIGQPSVGVITFDGRNSLGVPYDFVNNSAGYTDTLTSRPIDLSALRDSSVYLSFYWQQKGLGSLPKSTDSLSLYFLDKNKNWKEVWSYGGGIGADSVNRFFQQLIAVSDTSFFHSNFQFRFVAYGQQSGPFDIWSIDYVYLNKGRNAKDYYLQDVAMSQIYSTILKRYSSMPLNQFMVNPAKEIADSLQFEVHNLGSNARIFNYNFELKDKVSQTVWETSPVLTIPQGKIDSLSKANAQTKVTPMIAINAGQTSAELQMKVVNLNSKDFSISGLNLSANDTIAHSTTLSDYYAYDDGTAEAGADFTQIFGKVAVQFVLNKPDTLSMIRINFNKAIKNIAGQYYYVQLYDNKNGKPNQLLLQQSVRIAYPDQLNGFVNDTLFYDPSQKIVLKDTFYVGYVKLSNDEMYIGLDKNSQQFRTKYFYNSGKDWIQNDQLMQGSMMIRPVMGKRFLTIKGTVTATESEKTTKLIAYPNPNEGILSWNLDNVKQIKIFDTAGVVVFEKDVSSTENRSVNLQNLKAGTYLVNFFTPQMSFVKKIVIIK